MKNNQTIGIAFLVIILLIMISLAITSDNNVQSLGYSDNEFVHETQEQLDNVDSYTVMNHNETRNYITDGSGVLVDTQNDGFFVNFIRDNRLETFYITYENTDSGVQVTFVEHTEQYVDGTSITVYEDAIMTLEMTENEAVDLITNLSYQETVILYNALSGE